MDITFQKWFDKYAVGKFAGGCLEDEARKHCKETWNAVLENIKRTPCEHTWWHPCYRTFKHCPDCGAMLPYHIKKS